MWRNGHASIKHTGCFICWQGVEVSCRELHGGSALWAPVALIRKFRSKLVLDFRKVCLMYRWVWIILISLSWFSLFQTIQKINVSCLDYFSRVAVIFVLCADVVSLETLTCFVMCTRHIMENALMRVTYVKQSMQTSASSRCICRGNILTPLLLSNVVLWFILVSHGFDVGLRNNICCDWFVYMQYASLTILDYSHF